MSEKLDFFDALRIVAGTKRKLRYKDGKWYCCKTKSIYGGLYIPLEGNSDLSLFEWWPTPEQQKEKAWEVEPKEPEKSKEICVWGTCDKDGRSRIMHTPDGSYGIFLTEDNLFPKDKPQKFKLVPADQPGILWRKFDPDEMSKNQTSYIINRKGCFPESARWTYQSGDWRFERIDGDVLKDVDFYCHVSKIPKPEISDE
jgi:hypothetical protein